MEKELRKIEKQWISSHILEDLLPTEICRLGYLFVGFPDEKVVNARAKRVYSQKDQQRIGHLLLQFMPMTPQISKFIEVVKQLECHETIEDEIKQSCRYNITALDTTILRQALKEQERVILKKLAKLETPYTYMYNPLKEELEFIRRWQDMIITYREMNIMGLVKNPDIQVEDALKLIKLMINGLNAYELRLLNENTDEEELKVIDQVGLRLRHVDYYFRWQYHTKKKIA
jgi:hypothetical protein